MTPAAWWDLARGLRIAHRAGEGDWLWVASHAPDLEIINEINSGEIEALVGMDVQTFHRRSEPEATFEHPNERVTWEIYVRIKPE